MLICTQSITTFRCPSRVDTAWPAGNICGSKSIGHPLFNKSRALWPDILRITRPWLMSLIAALPMSSPSSDEFFPMTSHRSGANQIIRTPRPSRVSPAICGNGRPSALRAEVGKFGSLRFSPPENLDWANQILVSGRPELVDRIPWIEVFGIRFEQFCHRNTDFKLICLTSFLFSSLRYDVPLQFLSVITSVTNATIIIWQTNIQE